MFLRPWWVTLQKWVLSSWYMVDYSFYDVIFDISSLMFIYTDDSADALVDI